MSMRSAWLQRAALVLTAGLFLAAIGAFGSSAMAWPARAAYWIAAIAVGLACAEGAAAMLGRLLPGDTPRWLFGLALSLIITLPISLFVGLVNGAVVGDFGPAGLAGLLFSVWVICAAMTALALLLDRARQPDAPGEAPGAAFARRLPPKLRAAELWAVSAEDHYLRVRTSAGDTLILMRLSDAEAELAGMTGLRVHRSWWVAERGVEAVRGQSGGRALIRLKDGAEAPVSRTYRPALKQAGWL